MKKTPIKRYLLENVQEFLENRMVFVGGPRQVGKTTFCLSFLSPASVENEAYMNWDDIHARSKIKKAEIPADKKVIFFDEIHKFKNWRSLIKGIYDTKKHRHKFIVTGSARLDYYRRGGDSLLGRYRYLRLHPFSLGELGVFNHKTTVDLLQFGGFPEPFMIGAEKNLKLWHKERSYRLIYDDIRELELLKDINTLELLIDLLPSKVGSPLSYKNIADDLEVHHATVKNWIRILNNVYYSFCVPPFGAPKIKAVKKENKLYLWDWSEIQNPGARFENMVASQLLKYCHFVEDTEGDKMELRFLRDKDKREVDFVVIKNNQPEFAVECKTGEKGVSPYIHYFLERTKIPMFYQVHLGEKHFEPKKGIRVIPFGRFCEISR